MSQVYVCHDCSCLAAPNVRQRHALRKVIYFFIFQDRQSRDCDMRGVCLYNLVADGGVVIVCLLSFLVSLYTN